MARYVLHSSNKNKDGNYWGAIYQDGNTIKAWGWYKEIYEDPKATEPVVAEDIQKYLAKPKSTLLAFTHNQSGQSVGWAINEVNNDAPAKETLDRLNSLKYAF